MTKKEKSSAELKNIRGCKGYGRRDRGGGRWGEIETEKEKK